MKTSKHKNIKIQKYKNKNCLNVCMLKCLNDNKGYSAIVSVFLVTTIGIIIAISTTNVLIKREKIVRNIVNSAQSYYTAEASIEDILLRVIDPAFEYQTTETLTLAGSTASTTVVISGSTLTILSDGNKNDRVRSLSVELGVSTSGTSFSYGIQSGQGGILMKNNSSIIGNLYSNGNVVGVNSANVTGDVFVAGPTGLIDNFAIGGDAHANTIIDTVIAGDAYYQSISGGSVGGVSYPGSPDPDSTEMPISQDQIDTWKQQALDGGELIGDQFYEDGNSSLGPKKIVGNLTISGNGNDIFTLTGSLWVTGNIILENNGVLVLDSGYGANGGIIVADGKYDFKNNFIICGSEGYDTGENDCNTPNDSYVMLLTTNSSKDVGDPAMHMQNNTRLRGILYAGDGILFIENDADLKEATAYQIQVENNTTITYESGLVNLNFTSGPGGGWNIVEWKEVE